MLNGYGRAGLGPREPLGARFCLPIGGAKAPRRLKPALLCLMLTTAVCAFGDTKEEPVGLVLNPGGGKLLRSDTETPIALRAGDLLFTGDSLRTEASPASYLFCPAKSLQTLSASGE